MSNSASERPTIPGTVWQARGRHTGSDAADVLRRNLSRLKASGVLADFTEPPLPEDSPELVFEARWRAVGEVTVRARLTLVPPPEREHWQEWRLVAEAERPWDERWPSPATMFWPDDGTEWDHHHAVAGLHLRDVNALSTDDKAMRRVLKSAARESWAVQLVVHEAMTPDECGRLPLARLLPPGLRHRVVEHRASPQQLRAVNWALRDLGVEVPRGGAVLLPPDPAPPGYDAGDFAVRSVFLDGSEPAELVDVLRRFTALPKPQPQGAAEALTDLRENWTLMTPEEELAHARRLVAMYSEALEAMTRSRDLYREAAERAQEALAAYRDLPAAVPGPRERPGTRAGSPFQQLTRGFGRLRGTAKGLRPASGNDASRDGDDSGDEADRP
ncbi:hypothetical protein [Streptomyces brasiliensis]|uniref:Uncharacterized protein n=1 Tax=Streptomyces brasiliensis TaxID=1954 RepID=A0A917NF48_9ACTN|nr:hypothetical protein [Streptomyces brasiliensis]GGI96201.1 hypothetical protein GCM10010121_003340 [Streptomyces brasiliensis]